MGLKYVLRNCKPLFSSAFSHLKLVLGLMLINEHFLYTFDLKIGDKSQLLQ